MKTTFLSLKQAAERVGMSRQRLQQLAADGKLKGAYKAGATWIIPESALASPLRQRQHNRRASVETLPWTGAAVDQIYPETTGFASAPVPLIPDSGKA